MSRPVRARGVRDAGHHQPHRAGRRDARPRIVTPELLMHAARLAVQRHRLRSGRLLLAQRASRVPPARAVRAHRAGRGRRRQQGRRRGRPGHHVRLRLHRDAGAYAGAALLRAPHPAPDQRAAPQPRQVCRRACCPTPSPRSRCATSTASQSAPTSVVVSTQHEEGLEQHADQGDVAPAASRAACPRAGCPTTTRSTSTRPAPSSSAAPTAIAASRAQDHRGHLRRRGPARRRRVLGQGPHQGGPLRGLRRALRGQERGGRRPGRALHHPGLLRHRREQALLGLLRPARHWPRRGRGEARPRGRTGW